MSNKILLQDIIYRLGSLEIRQRKMENKFIATGAGLALLIMSTNPDVILKIIGLI